MPSARLLVWGAAGGIVGGVLLALGNLLAFFAGEGGPLAITGSWLSLVGFVATILLAIGLHEVLRPRAVGGEGLAALLAIIGSALLVAVAYVGLGAAYEVIDEPFYLDSTTIGVMAIGSGAFALGFLLFGVAILRADSPLPPATGVLLLVAVAAFLIGLAVIEVAYLGAIVFGAAAVWIGVVLNGERARIDTT